MHYFIWNGVNSQEMGLLVESLPPITRPPVRYKTVQIPGRAGELTLKEGKDVYETYIREVRAMPLGPVNIGAILAWLRDEGEVTFSHEPERVQSARIYDQIDFAHAFANQREGTIRFICDPFKRQLPAEGSITFDEQHPIIFNPGDVISWPELKITGEGSVAVTIGGTRQAYPALDPDVPVHVDCEAGFVYTRGSEDPTDAEYSERTPYTTYGDFPFFAAGPNIITLEGDITELVITPHWRWL